MFMVVEVSPNSSVLRPWARACPLTVRVGINVLCELRASMNIPAHPSLPSRLSVAKAQLLLLAGSWGRQSDSRRCSDAVAAVISVFVQWHWLFCARVVRATAISEQL